MSAFAQLQSAANKLGEQFFEHGSKQFNYDRPAYQTLAQSFLDYAKALAQSAPDLTNFLRSFDTEQETSNMIELARIQQLAKPPFNRQANCDFVQNFAIYQQNRQKHIKKSTNTVSVILMRQAAILFQSATMLKRVSQQIDIEAPIIDTARRCSNFDLGVEIQQLLNVKVKDINSKSIDLNANPNVEFFKNVKSDKPKLQVMQNEAAQISVKQMFKDNKTNTKFDQIPSLVQKAEDSPNTKILNINRAEDNMKNQVNDDIFDEQPKQQQLDPKIVQQLVQQLAVLVSQQQPTNQTGRQSTATIMNPQSLQTVNTYPQISQQYQRQQQQIQTQIQQQQQLELQQNSNSNSVQQPAIIQVQPIMQQQLQTADIQPQQLLPQYITPQHAEAQSAQIPQQQIVYQQTQPQLSVQQLQPKPQQSVQAKQPLLKPLNDSVDVSFHPVENVNMTQAKQQSVAQPVQAQVQLQQDYNDEMQVSSIVTQPIVQQQQTQKNASQAVQQQRLDIPVPAKSTNAVKSVTTEKNDQEFAPEKRKSNFADFYENNNENGKATEKNKKKPVKINVDIGIDDPTEKKGKGSQQKLKFDAKDINDFGF